MLISHGNLAKFLNKALTHLNIALVSDQFDKYFKWNDLARVHSCLKLMMSHIFVTAGVVIVQGNVLVQYLQHFMIKISVFYAVQAIIWGIFIKSTWQVIDYLRTFSWVVRNQLYCVHVCVGGQNFLICFYQSPFRLINSFLPFEIGFGLNNRIRNLCNLVSSE